MRSERTSTIRAAIALAAAIAAGGCAHSQLADSAVDRHPSTGQELDFWQELEARPLLTNHDALHGLLLLADGRDEHAGWTARLAAARERRWVGADEELEPEEAAAVGLVSRIACDVLRVGSSVTLRTFGPSRRYCTRELVFLGLLPERSPGQALTGAEFVDLAGRLEDWRRAHAATTAARGGAP